MKVIDEEEVRESSADETEDDSTQIQEGVEPLPHKEDDWLTRVIEPPFNRILKVMKFVFRWFFIWSWGVTKRPVFGFMLSAAIAWGHILNYVYSDTPGMDVILIGVTIITFAVPFIGYWAYGCPEEELETLDMDDDNSN